MRPPGEEFVRVAREYLGTPWMHAQRQKGIAVDCVGLFICVARDLGLTTWNAPNYSRYFQPQGLIDDIELFYDKVGESWLLAWEGDLLVFEFRRGIPQHVGMATMYRGRPGVLHAYEGAGLVVEHELTPAWKRRVCGVYTWKEEGWRL